MIEAGCKKPYMPPAITATSNYLVVEGVINTGQDSTIVRLSHTVTLSSTVGTTPEVRASVVVESDAHTSYPLTETGNGYYSSPGLNLSSSNKYHLKITTADSKAYQSDFVTPKDSPPIDSVYYMIQNNGLRINVDTHDPSNHTTYYRWGFNETWQIHSAFYSSAVYSKTPKDTVLYRDPANQIYSCWLSKSSSNIILGSSAKLSSDVIKGNELSFISSTSDKISVRYSVLVKQYALTAEAYNYWTQLKKNTEQLGSIFDAQPSEILGNIHCITDPAEPVIGYISAGAVAKKRIFVDAVALPAWIPTTPFDGCRMDTLYYAAKPNGRNEVKDEIYSGNQIPLFPILLHPGPPIIIIGYAAGTPECVDCTLYGSNKQPDFW